MALCKSRLVIDSSLASRRELINSTCADVCRTSFSSQHPTIAQATLATLATSAPTSEAMASMSDLYARRAIRRACIQELQAKRGLTGPGAPQSHSNQQPSCPDAYHSSAQTTPAYADPKPQSHTSLPAFVWPKCPVEGHTSCYNGSVFYYADSEQGRQQRELLEQSGFGADFFDYGNPPPAIWAAVLRVMEGRISKPDLNILYMYRFNHCPSRRREILEERWKAELEEFYNGGGW